MSIRLSSLYGCAFVALCLGLIQLSAKPPDLPVDESVKCRELSSGNDRYDGGLVPAGAVSGAIELDRTPGKSPCDPEICESAKPIDTMTPCWNEMFRGWWDTITDWIGGDAQDDTNTGIDPAGDFPVAYSRQIGADGLERIGVDFDNPQQLVQADAIGAACGASATILTTGYGAAADAVPTQGTPDVRGRVFCGAKVACGAAGKCKSASDCCKKGKCCADDTSCVSDCCKKGKCCADDKSCASDCCKKGKCCADDKSCASDCCKKGKCCADNKACASDCCKKGKCCAAECESKASCKTGSPCCAKTKACSECADSGDCCCSTDKCKAGKACCATAKCCVAIKACPVCECPKGECTCGKGSACSNDCKCGSTAGCGVKIKCCSAKACPACECPKGECECQAGAACNAKCKCGSTAGCGVKIKCCSAKACPACECPKGECECQAGAACNAKCKCAAGNAGCCCMKMTGACKCAAAHQTSGGKKVKVLVELKPAGKTCAACACCKSCSHGVAQVIKICWKDLKYGVVESAREQALLKQAQRAKGAGQVKQAAHLYMKLAHQTCDQELVKRCKHEVMALQGEHKTGCPVRACCSCFGKVMHICWKDFKETMKAVARGETEVPAPKAPVADAPRKTPVANAPGSPVTCPYLKQQQAAEKAPAIKKVARECTPLDNLRALEQAEKLCDKADRLADKGKLDEAAKLYEQVKDLCPGSRFDYLATQKLREVTAQKLDQQKDPAGEEEEKTDDVPDDGGQACLPKCGQKKACSAREIERRLNMPVNFDFQDVSLEEIVDEMCELSGINIVFDRRDMQEAGVDLAHLVNIKADGIALKSALNLLLDRVKLTWTCKDDVLVITTPAQARGGMITRTYEVADLVIPVEGTPGCRKNQTLEKDLIKLITSTIEPQSWGDMGGPGTMDYFPLGYALVSSQTPDVHEQISELLTALRRMQDVEVSLDVRLITIPERRCDARLFGADLDKIMLVNEQQMMDIKDVMNDPAACIQTPKVTLFNGQKASYKMSGMGRNGCDAIKLTTQALAAAKRDSTRVALAIDLAKPWKMDKTLTIPTGQSAVLLVSKTKEKGVGMCNLVMVTPRIITNEEQEQTIQTTAAVESAPVSKGTPAVSYTCPYMKQQQAAAKATTECEPAIAESALENLDKLDRARKLFGKAEQLRKKGQEAQAREIYETVQQLCPGSRYDAMACERLSSLTNPPATGEEQGDEQGCKTTEEDVAELLEACQRALAAGDYEKANQLAERAQELDPECVAANALVYKAHLLIHLEEKRQDAAAKQMRKVRHERQKANESGVILIPSPCEQYIREAIQRHVELQPHMPGIDPSIVPALERVITEVEKAGWEHEAGEESEDLSPLDGDEEYPGCVDQSNDPHADAAACVRSHPVKMLDTLRQAVGADVDVDCTRGVRCQVQVGGVTCRLENGPVSFVVVSWTQAEEKPDLHAQQREHQEQVIEWIESVSTGEDAAD